MLGPALASPSVLSPSLSGRSSDDGIGRRLDTLIEGWWAVTTSGSGTVVPDGGVDLLVAGDQLPVVAGPDIVPRPIDLPPGLTVVGLRLRPGVAGAILGDRLDRVVGERVALDQTRSRVELGRLKDDLDRAESAGEGTVGTARALARCVTSLVPTGWHGDPVVADAVAAIAAGRRPDAGGLGARQFRRRFTAAMGYGPTVYSRIVRLDRFTDLLGAHHDRTLAQLAATAGYYDQAHLTRDCRDLLGTTPGELRRVW